MRDAPFPTFTHGPLGFVHQPKIFWHPRTTCTYPVPELHIASPPFVTIAEEQLEGYAWAGEAASRDPLAMATLVMSTVIFRLPLFLSISIPITIGWRISR